MQSKTKLSAENRGVCEHFVNRKMAYSDVKGVIIQCSIYFIELKKGKILARFLNVESRWC